MRFKSRLFRRLNGAVVILALALGGCAQYATVKVDAGGPLEDEELLEAGAEVRLDYAFGPQSDKLQIQGTDSDGLTTDDGRHLIAQQLVVGRPRQLTGEVSGDPERCPSLELGVHVALHVRCRQAERVADEVHLLAAIVVTRHEELLPEPGERVFLVELGCRLDVLIRNRQRLQSAGQQFPQDGEAGLHLLVDTFVRPH